MPLIELNGTPDDMRWVLAVMLFPDNQKLREQCYLVNKLRLEVQMLEEDSSSLALDAPKLELDAQTLKQLLEAPSYNEIKGISADSVKKAVIAGDMLACLYLMDVFDMDEPSINKVIHVMRQYAVKGGKYGDGQGVPGSERYLRKYWAEYKSVAHLWAALRINQSYPFAEKREAFSPSGFPLFLGVAQEMFKFGSNFIPLRARPPTSILSASDSWVLPSSIDALKLRSDRLPDRLVKLLKNYSAPPAQY